MRNSHRLHKLARAGDQDARDALHIMATRKGRWVWRTDPITTALGLWGHGEGGHPDVRGDRLSFGGGHTDGFDGHGCGNGDGGNWRQGDGTGDGEEGGYGFSDLGDGHGDGYEDDGDCHGDGDGNGWGSLGGLVD